METEMPFAEAHLKVLEQKYLKLKEVNADLLEACKGSLDALDLLGNWAAHGVDKAIGLKALKIVSAAIARAEA